MAKDRLGMNDIGNSFDAVVALGFWQWPAGRRRGGL